MPDVALGSVPFPEAIEFLTKKLRLPTRFSSDLRGQANAKAFTIAGALKADLLKDLHDAVNAAIQDGETIADFRKRFDKIVQDHGWHYRGKRGWRTRVIYDINMRTARMAGKWQQFERLKKRRPFLIYKTVGDERVRPEHAQWDNTVLPIDDPFWNTHYPPNGWGCRCTVRSASRRDLDRQGLSVTDRPPLNLEPRVNTRTGEDLGEVPAGIDTGWDYNVGKAWLGPELAFGEKAIQLPDALRSAVLGDTQLLGQLIQKPYTSWARSVLERGQAIGEVRTVGYLNNKVIGFATEKGMPPITATVTLTDDRLLRMQRDLKRRRGIDLSVSSLFSIPTLLARPQAILWDKAKRNLLYVFRDQESAKAGKIVVNINFKERTDISNSIRSASRIPVVNLLDKNQYELIEGDL